MVVNPSQSISNEQLKAALLAYPKLLAVARRITGCMTLAEDVVQEVLLQLVSKPLKSDIAAPAAYVIRMVRNLARDHMRRRRYERFLFVEEQVGGSTSAYGSPEERLRETEAYKAFRCTVEAMPARTRKFYEEHYFEDVPQNIIAKEAGVSCALVCGLLRDAHSRCLAAISPDAGRPRQPYSNHGRHRSPKLREMRA